PTLFRSPAVSGSIGVGGSEGPLMRCPACGFENSSGTKFCGNCGAWLTTRCPSCGSENPHEVKFCGEYGQRLHQLIEPTVAQPTSHGTGTRDAERRQLTVMFCDLVASSKVAERIDVEDLRDIIHRYYDACTQTIQRWEGHVARYIGDAVLAYF